MVYFYFLLGDSEHSFSLSSWTGVFSSGFASVSLIGLIFPGEIFSGLSFFSLNSLLAGGGFFSAVLSGDLCVSFVLKAVSCLILFLDDSALCWFFFVGVGFCFLGVFFAALFLPVFLELSFAWFRLKQLAIKKGVGLHLNSPLIGSSLQGNSSTISWSRYRLFKFGRTVPSQPLYETLFRYTFNFLRRRSSAKKRNITFAQQCDDELKVPVTGTHGWFGFSIIIIYQGSILNQCWKQRWSWQRRSLTFMTLSDDYTTSCLPF